MTVIEPYRETPAVSGTLGAWAEEAVAAASIAADLAPTPFVPASLRVLVNSKPDVRATTANITAALLTGQELGLSPMASLRSIDIVQGTPALRAVALRGLLQQAGHEIWVEESTKTRAVVKGRRKGSDKIQESVWTWDRAKDLGITGRDNWRKQPTAMLIARATAEIARLVAADAILGLPYIAEELEDGYEPSDVETVVPLKPRRTAQRKPRSAEHFATVDEDGIHLHEPPLDDIRAVPVQETPPPDAINAPLPDEPPLDDLPTPLPLPVPGLITAAQLKMLHATLRDMKITDRNDGLALISNLAGRDITSSKELTTAEASHVIDELTRGQFTDDEPPV